MPLDYVDEPEEVCNLGPEQRKRVLQYVGVRTALGRNQKSLSPPSARKEVSLACPTAFDQRSILPDDIRLKIIGIPGEDTKQGIRM